jgi:hypothetical protein
MTNAIDVLLVGGVEHGQMVCCNLAQDGAARWAGYIVIPWWRVENQRWYWVALPINSTPINEVIEQAVAIYMHQPAWNMRDKPAPSGGIESNEES